MVFCKAKCEGVAEVKIIVVNYRYYVAGGPERYMFNFMDAARKRGIEVIPFSIDYPNNIYSEYASYFASARSRTKEDHIGDIRFSLGNIYRIVRATVYNTEAKRKLSKLIKDTQPDAVYVLHEINTLSPSVIDAAKENGVRVVHRLSDFFMVCANCNLYSNGKICEKCSKFSYDEAIKNRCVKDSKWGTILRVLAMKIYDKKKIFNKVDSFVSPSIFTKKTIQRLGYEDANIEVVPTFTDLSVVPCYKNKGYFVYSGRIARYKGVHVAIEAMKYCDNEAKLYLTGNLEGDEYSQYLKSIIQKNGLSDRIVFVGFLNREDLCELIKNAICVLCPSLWYENMPNAVIEAFALGKSVIASQLGSLSELIKPSYNGFLFDPGNPKDLSKYLNKYLACPGLSAELGHNARKECEQKYNDSVHLDKILRVLSGQVG